MALLYLEQEDAFWCLVTIVEVFMPRDYYTKTLLGSQVRLETPRVSQRPGESSRHVGNLTSVGEGLPCVLSLETDVRGGRAADPGPG